MFKFYAEKQAVTMLSVSPTHTGGSGQVIHNITQGKLITMRRAWSHCMEYANEILTLKEQKIGSMSARLHQGLSRKNKSHGRTSDIYKFMVCVYIIVRV